MLASNPSSYKTYRVLGLMSGSSLDGLDIAFCHLVVQNNPFKVISWAIEKAETLAYTMPWIDRLQLLPNAPALELAAADVAFGRYIGELIQVFLTTYNLKPDFIASHGHTIFHYPAEGFTTQIGNGTAITATTKLPVVCNFRAEDVAAGGQGAPLAPVADKYLFSNYDFCLNIGGIINLTFQTPEKVIAFDITGANQVLNALALEVGTPYDKDGDLAASGNIIPDLLEEANHLLFFATAYPKSLGNNWVQAKLLPIFQQTQYPVADRLRTACEHIAFQTAQAIAQIKAREQLTDRASYRLLPTGGGAYNLFLMQRLSTQLNTILPITIEATDNQLIEFKEALLIALLGVMRLERIPNSFSSVTGASHDTVNGTIHRVA